MSASLRSSADGSQAILGLNGADKVVIGSQGIEAGSFKPGSIRPVDTQLGATPSMVRLNTANGYGSTNTAIRRFTTVVTNQGSDITYADSATLGASFTINTAGVYAISFSDIFNQGAGAGITLNDTSMNTAISASVLSQFLNASTSAGNNYTASCNWTGYLPAGSVIRPHTDGYPSSTIPALTNFTIQRVA